MSLEERIRQLLLGKKLSEAERVLDLVRLFFEGDGEVVISARCLVRVVQMGRLVASSADMVTPAIDVESGSIGDFQWNADFTAYDFGMKGYLKRVPRPAVSAVSIEDCGDMILALDDGSEIQILIDSTLCDREQWRVYREGTADFEHIVRYPSEFRLE